VRATLVVGEGASRIVRHQPTIEVGEGWDVGERGREGVGSAEHEEEAEEEEREIDSRREEISIAVAEGEASAKPMTPRYLHQLTERHDR